MAELGHQVCLICPGEKTRTTQGVQVVGYRRGEGSFGRTMVSPLALRPALKQKADIYHIFTSSMGCRPGPVPARSASDTPPPLSSLRYAKAGD